MNVPEPPPPPNIIGHRGVAGHAPDNTLASIRDDGFGVGRVPSEGRRLVPTTKPWIGRIAVSPRSRAPGHGFKGERIPTLAETADLLVEQGVSANIEIKPARGYARETGQAVGAFLAAGWDNFDRFERSSMIRPKSWNVWDAPCCIAANVTSAAHRPRPSSRPGIACRA